MRSKSIKIKGADWKVFYMHHEDNRLEGNNGMCLYGKKHIYLSKKPDASPSNCYWHEYLHAYLWECGVRSLDSHFEHVIVENLADLLERVSK